MKFQCQYIVTVRSLIEGHHGSKRSGGRFNIKKRYSFSTWILIVKIGRSHDGQQVSSHSMDLVCQDNYGSQKA